MGVINKVFLYNGDPQNGATAQLWQITSFAAYTDSTATVQDNPLAATDIECLTSDGTVFAVGDVIRMGTEYCLIWAISVNTLYIVRAFQGSAAGAHIQGTVIYDQTVTPPQQDDAVPVAGQQGGDITTGVAYGGDGAYRFDDVPEMDYYASVTYDGHVAYVYCSVEVNDVTPQQLMTVRGDMLYRDANTVTRKALGANSFIIQSDGTDWDWIASAGLIPTREKWYPATYGVGGPFNIGDYASIITDNTEIAYISGRFPWDFTAITSLVLVLIPSDTNGTADMDIDSDYAAAGEAYNTHSEADAATTYALTANQIFELDLTGIFSAEAADDYFGVKLSWNEVGERVYVLGIRLRYT